MTILMPQAFQLHLFRVMQQMLLSGLSYYRDILAIQLMSDGVLYSRIPIINTFISGFPVSDAITALLRLGSWTWSFAILSLYTWSE